MQTLEQIVHEAITRASFLSVEAYMYAWNNNSCGAKVCLDKLQQLRQDVILQIEQYIKEK